MRTRCNDILKQAEVSRQELKEKYAVKSKSKSKNRKSKCSKINNTNNNNVDVVDKHA